MSNFLNTNNRNVFLIIAALAIAQIAACLVVSGLTQSVLDPTQPEYWLSVFNHLVSISTLVVVAWFWINPLTDRLAQSNGKLDDFSRRNAEINEVLRGHIGWQFEVWGLTPSERDVALLSLKGLRISEIAEYRSSREGTVKAHLNGIFKKAKVSSRHELLATCLESFIDLGCPNQDGRHLTQKDAKIISNFAKVT